MKIIFCKTRYEYPSYNDFRHLVEVSGFDTCYVDEIDYSKPNIYIFNPLNGETRFDHGADNIDLPIHAAQKHKKKRCKIVWLNIERPDKALGLEFHRKKIDHMRDAGFIDECWVYDRSLASWVGEDYARFVPFGGHPYFAFDALGTPPQKDLPATAMAATSGRRSGIFTTLKDVLWQLPNDPINLATKHQNLARTKIMLYIHQDEWKYITPTRFIVAAGYGMCLVTEHCDDLYPLDESCVISCSLDEAEETVRATLKNPDLMVEKALKLNIRLCQDFTFKEYIERAAKEMQC